MSSNFYEIIISGTENRRSIFQKVKQGKLRKIASSIYSSNFSDPPEDIIKRHIWYIVSQFAPGALIADRTALELKPASDGSIFIISNRKRDITLPGITIRPRKGKLPLEDDKPFLDGLYLSSIPRAYLENMKISRPRKDDISRTLEQKEIEEKLENILRKSGESALQKIRDEARKISLQLGLQKEFTQLDTMIGTLLGTRNMPVLSNVALARKMGEAYDPDRLILFEILHRELYRMAPSIKQVIQENTILAFYEAYFSNFIEGTEFAVNEAEEIIFEGKVPNNRPIDAHDIISTYRIVSDIKEMQRIPKSFEDFLSLLCKRHAIIMEKRPENLPGSFKLSSNRAGSTLFVEPELVKGTLKKGFELYTTLDDAFQRAVFMMFLIAEVHPFVDGNGRMARIMMNSELVSKGEQKIIIPTIYRNNYLVALKAITHNKYPEPLIRTLDFAQRYTKKIDWTNKVIAQKMLKQTNAFVDPNEADVIGVRLILPK